MRVVAFQAIARIGRVNRPRNRCRILVFVAGKAQRRGRRRDELDARNLFVNTNFMAAQAVDFSLGMGRLGARLLRVTGDAFRRIDAGIKRGVAGSLKLRNGHACQHHEHNKGYDCG